MHGYVPPAPAFGRRRRIYLAAIAAGVTLMTAAWGGVLAGWLPPAGTAHVTSALVIPLLLTPFAALWDNPGERRTRVQRLAEFAYCWVLVSGVTQTAFELPWFFLDLTGTIHNAGPGDHWLWMWWAYGGADTRYLTSNPTIAGIELCAGIAGPLELYACYLFKRNRRIAANWLALLLGVGLTWGTIIFFVAEVHVGLADLRQGAFGLWVKWLGLNLPWMISPFFFIPGSILDLQALYEHRGATRASHSAVPAVAAANDEAAQEASAVFELSDSP